MCVVIMSGYEVPDLCILESVFTHTQCSNCYIEKIFYMYSIWGGTLCFHKDCNAAKKLCLAWKFFPHYFQFWEGLSWQLCALHCLDASVLINL